MDAARITEYLKAKYAPEAIVLHGSRARGRAARTSDWDVDVFVREPKEGGPEMWGEALLDVEVVPLTVSDADLRGRERVHLRKGTVLFDAGAGVGQEMVARAEQAYAAGRGLSRREAEYRRVRLWRILQRLMRTPGEPEVFAYHLAHFYPSAIRYWFEMKDRWSEPIYEAMEIIAAEDPRFWQLVRVLAAPGEGRCEAAEEIYSRIFGQPPA